MPLNDNNFSYALTLRDHIPPHFTATVLTLHDDTNLTFSHQEPLSGVAAEAGSRAAAGWAMKAFDDVAELPCGQLSGLTLRSIRHAALSRTRLTGALRFIDTAVVHD